MGKASEIWKEIKPKVGEMLMAVNDIETQAEKAQEEAYQRGLNDAWEVAQKIANMPYGEEEKAFGSGGWSFIDKHTASEAIEKIRQYEQEKEEQESITVEDVMRQYLDKFCKGQLNCAGCPLRTPDFTCGRGKHFLHDRVSDEEVRRAYFAVLQKMKESNDNK